MSVRMKLVGLVDVILRVPPLFIMDELFRIGLGFPQTDITNKNTYDVPNSNSTFNYTEEEPPMADFTVNILSAEVYQAIVFKVLKCIMSCLGVLAAVCIFMLWTKHLVVVYMYLMSVGIVFVSYWTNVTTMKMVIGHADAAATTSEQLGSSASVLEDILLLNHQKLLDPRGMAFIIFQNYVIQCILAFVFICVHLGPRYAIIQKVLPFSFMAPSFLAVLPVPHSVLHHAPVFSALLPLALVKFVLWYSAINIGQTIYGGYSHARSFVGNFGLSALVETEWQRLRVPTVLRTFWMLRVAEHAALLIAEKLAIDSGIGLLAATSLLGIVKSLLITGCETLTAVLGMTSVVSFICHYVGCVFQWVLLTEDDDDKSIGTVSAILFYILALQTGLTGLDPEKRFVRLCRNFCLLFTALLHFVHNIVNPVLMSLSASHNPSLRRHIRALAVCAFLVAFPASLLVYLWSRHETSTWLLAVSAFSVEVMVKVAVSLMIYALFLLDAYRTVFWEKLDDYVYYIRAFGNTVEFCFGIFLFFNGAWILIFESGGAIRAVMMCIHAYFNIWCEARAGWSVFMKRRTAVNKINSLPEANSEQLRKLDDVCAICYQEMKSAKITRCKHFFHGVCLRKWLYVQDRCPLCHDILYKVEVDSSKDSSEDLVEDVPVDLQVNSDQQPLPGTSSNDDNADDNDTNPPNQRIHTDPPLHQGPPR